MVVFMSLETLHGAPTYRFRAEDYQPVATATDILSLGGVAGKVVRINYVSVGGKANTDSLIDIYIQKRSAANTGGTSSNMLSAVSTMDSIDPRPLAPLLLYSANPTTLGASTTLNGDTLFLPGKSTPKSSPNKIEYGASMESKPCTLRTVNEFFTISLAGQAIPAGTELYISIEWTEDDV